MTDPKILLLVDDEPANIDLLKGIIQEDHKIKIAISGDKALKIVQKAPLPDLILLDVMMPEMDGYEVYRRLKADPATAGIPIIFVSGHTDEAERIRGLELGAIDFLSKPIIPEKVNAAIKAALG